MARISLTEAGPEASEAWLDQIKEENPAYTQATRLRGVIAFHADAGDAQALRAAVETDPKNVEAWYQLGATLAVASTFDGALSAFLEVVKVDREFREDAGRKALLSLFDLLGAEDDAVISARRQLACLLF
jgi:putative thioredoxin